VFRTFARKFLPNPLDYKLKRCARRGGKKILFCWNRGLGDIALGLYAMVQRTREIIPDAEITFMTREGLLDGFSMLEGVKTIGTSWKRGERVKVKDKSYDLIIENPSPTDWVRWQLGKVTPRLKWNSENEDLWKKFNLDPEFTYIGVQIVAETTYGLWRNWPLERWKELMDRLPGKVRVILFGTGKELPFFHEKAIDLRGKTTLFEMLSLIKNQCKAMILPDSGILSMVYYLDVDFPIQVVSLWADPNHGILKQGVASPNPSLSHYPFIGGYRDLSTVTVDAVLDRLFPKTALKECPNIEDVEPGPIEKVGCIILAGGQGTRLGVTGPKGVFSINEKTLFQWLCEKVPRSDLKIAIMTSPLNHEETVAYFKQNGNFGLELYFFQQEMEHFLNEEKLEIDMKGPCGNGSVFRSFVKAGLADLFALEGIDTLTVIPIENPLANPFDPALIAYHRRENCEVTIKCIERREGDQSMGALIERAGGIEMVEYTEMDLTQKYFYSNVGQFAFSLSFFKKMADVQLPMHWVQKKVPVGTSLMNVWKGEQFIFDCLSHASRVRALCASRESCYAPLKSQENIEAVQRAMR
jgi:UDP-N-acetylglucosamine/UDP-N-acetylgalactosamine diphosphorylase